MLGEINFQLKLRLREHQIFLFENCRLGKKRRSKVVGHLENFGGRGQKPSVTDLSHKLLATWLL